MNLIKMMMVLTIDDGGEDYYEKYIIDVGQGHTGMHFCTLVALFGMEDIPLVRLGTEVEVTSNDYDEDDDEMM